MPSGALCARNACAGGIDVAISCSWPAPRSGSGWRVAVRERPAVEAALHDAVQLAGREVVAEQIAAVVGRVELAAVGLPVEADGVAQPRREDLALAAVGPEAQHRRAARVLLDADVAARADRDVQPAVGAEAHRARPVVAAAGQPGDDALERARDACARRRRSARARRVGLADVEPAVVEVDAVRAVQPLEERPRRRRSGRRRRRRARAARPCPRAARSPARSPAGVTRSARTFGSSAKTPIARPVGHAERVPTCSGVGGSAGRAEEHVRDRHVHREALGQELAGAEGGDGQEARPPRSPARSTSPSDAEHRRPPRASGQKSEHPRGDPPCPVDLGLPTGHLYALFGHPLPRERRPPRGAAHPKRRPRPGDLRAPTRGSRAACSRSTSSRNKVRVEKVRVQKRHLKPGRKGMRTGGIVEQEGFVDASNVMLVDPSRSAPGRVKVETRDGKRVRVFSKSGTAVAEPASR